MRHLSLLIYHYKFSNFPHWDGDNCVNVSESECFFHYEDLPCVLSTEKYFDLKLHQRNIGELWDEDQRDVQYPKHQTLVQCHSPVQYVQCHYSPVQYVQCHYRNSALYKIVVTLWPAQPARSDALWIPIGFMFMSSLVWSKVAPLHLHILSSLQEGPPPTAQPTTDWWRGTRRSSVTTSTTRSGQPTLHSGLIRGWRWHKLIVLC